jgi:hypothetical protein
LALPNDLMADAMPAIFIGFDSLAVRVVDFGGWAKRPRFAILPTRIFFTAFASY